MNYKISKELFEAVTDDSYYYYELNDGGIVVDDKTHKDFMSHNDFFFICYEYLAKNGFDIITVCVEDWCNVRLEKEGQDVYNEGHYKLQQAVFDACEWILENK